MKDYLNHGLPGCIQEPFHSSRKSILKRFRVKLRVIICLLLFLSTGCREEIVHNLSESEANRLLAKLHQVNISSEKVKQPDNRWALAVDKENTIFAIKHLNQTRVFKKSQPFPSEKSALITSREDQRFRFERALSHEVESTLSSIDGILEARVHLNLPPVDPIFGHPVKKDHKSTASILLVTDGATTVESQKIAELVAGASGISVSDISVLTSTSENLNIQLEAQKVIHTADQRNNGIFEIFSLSNETLIQILISVMIILSAVYIYKLKIRRSALERLKNSKLISEEV